MIIGNNIQQDIVEKIIKEKTGAYLLVGPEGLGKFTLVQRILKESGFPSIDQLIVNLDHPEITINIVRENLQKFLTFKPKDQKKILVINDAHKLNYFAQNAFLKFLEEPLTPALIILISHLPGFLLPTIRSRLSVVRFNLVEPDLILSWLKRKNFDESKIKILLELFPGQPGLILKYLTDEQKFQLVEKIIKARSFVYLFPYLDQLLESFEFDELIGILARVVRKKLINSPNPHLFTSSVKEIFFLWQNKLKLNQKVQLANLLIKLYG